MPQAVKEYEKVYREAEGGIRSILTAVRKDCVALGQMTLDEHDRLVVMLAGYVAQNYREGAYHGDIDARGG